MMPKEIGENPTQKRVAGFGLAGRMCKSSLYSPYINETKMCLK